MATATSSQAALKELQAAEKTAQNPNDILSAQNQSLGVNSAQDTVTGLRGAINNTTKLLKQVAPSVMGRTGSSLVTNAQATKQISNEQAPISTNLTDENTQYGQESQDLDTLRQQAQTAASGIYQGQQDKESYLQNLYSTLYGKEQAAATKKAAAAAAAEQKREFNLKLALAKSSSGGSGGGSISLGGGSIPGRGNTQKTASMAPKNGKNGAGGFAFTNATGKPISAAKFASTTGQSLGSLLKSMGKAGDVYAAQAYNQISANQAYYAKHPEILKSEFKYLF